jgi:hypothetical protein
VFEVLADGAGTAPEHVPDRGIGTSGRNQFEHLPLTLSERGLINAAQHRG